ncbi:unnamed protein product [Peniophora sp. CBMAI 1063]|nr:unnamed protein product [Peniophora sp. CBMAI 1063]
MLYFEMENNPEDSRDTTIRNMQHVSDASRVFRLLVSACSPIWVELPLPNEHLTTRALKATQGKQLTLRVGYTQSTEDWRSTKSAVEFVTKESDDAKRVSTLDIYLSNEASIRAFALFRHGDLSGVQELRLENRTTSFNATYRAVNWGAVAKLELTDVLMDDDLNIPSSVESFTLRYQELTFEYPQTLEAIARFQFLKELAIHSSTKLSASADAASESARPRALPPLARFEVVGDWRLCALLLNWAKLSPECRIVVEADDVVDNIDLAGEYLMYAGYTLQDNTVNVTSALTAVASHFGNQRRTTLDHVRINQSGKDNNKATLDFRYANGAGGIQTYFTLTVKLPDLIDTVPDVLPHRLLAKHPCFWGPTRMSIQGTAIFINNEILNAIYLRKKGVCMGAKELDICVKPAGTDLGAEHRILSNLGIAFGNRMTVRLERLV